MLDFKVLCSFLLFIRQFLLLLPLPSFHPALFRNVCALTENVCLDDGSQLRINGHILISDTFGGTLLMPVIQNLIQGYSQVPI